jgi:ureidoglycolate lyase
MRTLHPEPLTAAAFAPFGDVIELPGAKQMPINAGTTIRFHDLAQVDVLAEGGRTLINLFRAQPRDVPVRLSLMERHPLGSQAFLPLAEAPYLVVVAEDDHGRPGALRAFVSSGWQGVNYARNVWHHPLLALGAVRDFIVVDRGGTGVNLEEFPLEEAVCVATDAFDEAR